MADKSHDDLLTCLQNTDQLNKTEKCKDVEKTKVILKKPTFIYNSPVKKQNLKNCCGKQKRNRTSSAPYYIKSVDDAFKTLAIDSKSTRHDDTTKRSVDTPNFSPLNKAPSLKPDKKWRNSESIIKPSKLKTVDFHKCRKYKTKQISVGKWDNKKSNITFEDLSYTSNKPSTTKFSHDQSQSRTFSKQSKTPKRSSLEKTCSFEARNCEVDMTPEELALYVEDYLVMPKKMSSMAEMMYL